MAKFHNIWTVLPHGPLREVDQGILSVVGQIPMPLGNFPRRMTVVALSDGRSAIYSPIALGDADMAAVEALGAPTYLIVPSGAHRLDAALFRARYPEARLITAPGAKAKVAEAVKVDATEADLGPRAQLITVAGTEGQELAMLVRHEGGVTLITNGIIGNVGHPQGPGAWLMARLMGFGPRAQVPRLIRRMLVSDPAALSAQMLDWAKLAGLRRLIPSHGDIIDQPAPELERLARTLD